MLLLIDNYDSFTYNLAQLFMRLGEEVRVVRNDEISLEEAEALDFDYLVISPGPGRPEGAGLSVGLVRRFAGRKPILGICLGHQAIGAAFGAKVVRAKRIVHGKQDAVTHDGRTLFANAPNPLRVMRYHSLALERESLPACLEVSATSSDGEIMAVRHVEHRIEGLQFHPESIGCEAGEALARNFLTGVRELPSPKASLRRIASREELSREEARSLMDMIAEGAASQAQIGAFLAGLTLKGATIEELTGFASSLYDKALRLPLPEGLALVDTCGTGGDSSGTFNISTASAFVAAGAGAKVAKHGNRSITSRSGSADVLEALGVSTKMGPAEAARAIEEVGMAFLFAPTYHPAFKNLGGPRRELGFRTVFNMMGPLLNPARAKAQVVGVYSAELTQTVARVLANLGVCRALAVHGGDGIDEISLAAPTMVTELRDGWTKSYTIEPADLGLEPCASADLKGGDSNENAAIVLRVLGGEPGPKRDVVLMNAGAAILVSGLAPDLRSAIEAARASIDSGKAMGVLARLRELSAEPTALPSAAGTAATPSPASPAVAPERPR
jgi:glutamine amidotransferase of anthranilate synthase or aminodeoxychorismate synthase